MKKATWLIALLAAWATIACNVTSLVQVEKVSTRAPRKEQVRVDLPAQNAHRDVDIYVGLGTLIITPGAEDALLEGSVTYNIKELGPLVVSVGENVRFQQGEERAVRIGELGSDVENECRLQLGPTPMSLTLNVGGATAHVELGGLSLTHLDLVHGAADMDLVFSTPNKVEMDSVSIRAGASNMVASGLANARADRLTFTGGAGNYVLHFDGQLQKDMRVAIDAGLGEIVIVIPEGVAAVATFDSAVSNLNAAPGWVHQEDKYVIEGQGPRIYLEIQMGSGTLRLENEG